jgi:hypothetical protein
MNIQIGFSNSESWISRFICWITNSHVSHTFLLIEIGGREFIAEAAIGRGFRMMLKHKWEKENTIVELVNPVVPLDRGWLSVENWLGEKYSYRGLLGCGWVMLGRKLKRQFHNPFHKSGSLFCSEANTKVIQESGWPGSENLIPSAMSPGDLLAFLKGNL